MNKKIALLCLLGLTNLAPATFGQFFYLVGKEQISNQTGNSTTSPDPSQPFRLNIQIGGSGEDASNPPPPNSFNGPGNGTTIPLNAPGVGNSEWQYQQSFSDQASLDAAFPNGNYTLTISGNTAAVPLVGDLYTNTPLGILSVSGAWSGNTYSIFAGQDLTISTNSIAGFTSGNFRVGIDASPSFGNGTVSDIQFDSSNSGFSVANGSITIPSSLLQVGDIWNIDLEFNAFSSLNPSALQHGTTVGLYTERTSFQIAAIPEPAETALMASVLALGLAAWRRRRART